MGWVRSIGVAVALVSLGGALPGCAGRGGARGSGEARVGAQGSASGSVEREGEVTRWRPTIQYAKGRLNYQGDIEFEYDSAALRSDLGTSDVLRQLVEYLERHPEVRLEVEGHTDSRGSEIYNLDLSRRRAATLRKWLVEHGIDEDRLTSAGYGESRPATAEPPECHNRAPQDPAPCQEAWQRNRRVVFTVTAGADTLPQADNAKQRRGEDEEVEELESSAEAAPRSSASAPTEGARECPQRKGVHVNILGPNATAGAAFAMDLTCWLEASIGLSMGFFTFEAERAFVRVEGAAVSFNVPGRVRLWPMETHSILLDAGVMVSGYGVAGSSDTAGITADYERSGSTLGGFLGVGYGYRGSGRFRIAALLGVMAQHGDLDDSRFDTNLPAVDAAVYRAGLDDLTDELLDTTPYVELSLGWLW